MPTTAHEPLLDAIEAAKYLGTTPRHLRRLVSAHGLQAVMLGGLRRYRRQDLDQFILSRMVHTDASAIGRIPGTPQA